MKVPNADEATHSVAAAVDRDSFLENFHVIDDQPRTAQERAYDIIRNGILRGELPPGTKLNQSAVARRLQVSTTPVREALGRLDGDGLVQIDAHRGAVVRGVDDAELTEIYELRMLLEPLAAKKAAAKITPAELATAEELWRRMKDYDDPVSWSDHNLKFHTVVVTASRSSRLQKILNELLASSALYVQFSLTKTPNRPQHANRDHWELLEALRNRDGERAARIEAAHLAKTVELLRSQDS